MSINRADYCGKSVDIAFVRDITRGKQIQKIMRIEKAKFSTILDGINEFIYIIDPKTYEILYANKSLKDILGRNPVGCICYKEFHGFDSPCYFCPSDIVIKNNGEPYYWQYHDSRLNRDYRVADRIIKWFDGRDVRFVFAMDVSELLAIRTELQKAHARMKQLFSAISSILVALNIEGKITEWNRPAEDLFGIARKDALRKGLFDLDIEWDKKKLKKALDRSRERIQTERLEELRYKGHDGKDRFLGMTINPMFDENSVMIGMMLRAADITKKKYLESQLAQAQKLESIGQLSAGIAHEINTPIQYVGDNIEFLKEGFDDLRHLIKKYEELLQTCKKGTGIEEAVQQVEEVAEDIDWEYLEKEIPPAIEQSLMGTERVANIVRAMKEFSHPGTDKKVPTDINRAIENTITVAKNEWKYVAAMVTDFDPSLDAVPCLPGELNQAILNIIVNAAQAIADVVGDGSKGKGTISIRTRRHKDRAEIQIKDTGTGISQENLSKIFDPFFTTKEVGRGTGQGLSLVYNVITVKHGGNIYVASTVGKGTTFTIRLPLETEETGSEEKNPVC
ncbi:MAG: PAS domain-containing protein [Nitrospiraceae bacterium]|nr:PAS domain-containing protein [Nitrospiraceae bacterium]